MYIAKQKQTHGYWEQTSGYQWEEGVGKRQDRSMGLRNTNHYINKAAARIECRYNTTNTKKHSYHFVITLNGV